MKKLLVTIAMLATMVCSSFALTISTGGSVNIGGIDSSEPELNGVTCGIGAFFNLDLILGFGFQSEINVTTSVVNIEDNKLVFSNASSTVDIPFMLWWNGKFGSIGVGAGAGINISANEIFYGDVHFGIAAGANLIYYFNDHIGLLVGATGVFDFSGQLYYENEYSEDKTYIGVKSEGWRRNNIYGKLGVMYRF